MVRDVGEPYESGLHEECRDDVVSTIRTGRARVACKPVEDAVGVKVMSTRKSRLVDRIGFDVFQADGAAWHVRCGLGGGALDAPKKGQTPRKNIVPKNAHMTSLTSTVLAHAGRVACVRLEGTVDMNVEDASYDTEGLYPITTAKIVVVNLTVDAVTLRDLPTTAMAYSHLVGRAMQTTSAGKALSVPAHPHAHWATRVRTFVDLARNVSDATYIGLIDAPPADEAMGVLRNPVSIDALDAHKRLVVLLTTNSVCYAALDGVKRRALDADAIGKMVTAPTKLFDVSPPMPTQTPLEYFNVLFGATKQPRRERHVPIELSSVLDDGLVPLGEFLALVDHTPNVSRVSFGTNKPSVSFTLDVQTATDWTITFFAPVSASLPSVTATCKTTSALLASIVSMLTAEPNEVVVHTERAMRESTAMLTALRAHPDLARIFQAVVRQGIAKWNEAMSVFSSETLKILPPRPPMSSSDVRFGARMHSVPMSE